VDLEKDDFKDDRILVEKLTEPPTRPILKIYDSVQRLNNPEVRKNLKVRRAEEMQAKIDEIN